MKVTEKVSTYIVDRRKRFAAGGFIAVLLAVVGIKLGTGTGTDKDPDRDLVFLVSTALDRGQLFWKSRVPGYRNAEVVIFDDSTETACGHALTSSGPFWCSGDQHIYLDLRFLRALPGDLGKAIVIGHELGHHVESQMHLLAAGRSSVDTELQADCLAGQWVRDEQARSLVVATDVADALRVIESVGDDRLCSSCRVEDWRHGSSAQRLQSFERGLTGAPCW